MLYLSGIYAKLGPTGSNFNSQLPGTVLADYDVLRTPVLARAHPEEDSGPGKHETRTGSGIEILRIGNMHRSPSSFFGGDGALYGRTIDE